MILKNKKVIVTGANRSIGREIALYFAKNGADVLISYRTDKIGAEATVQSIKEIGSNGLALYADFSQMAGVRAFTEEALNSWGTIDILVNNAGMLSRETLFELAPEKMQEVFQVNTLSPLYLTQLCIKNMIENQIKGCILNISSISGSYTMTGPLVHRGIAYASSKAAMNKWTKNAAMDLAKHGIRVNAIAPGIIKSGMNHDTETINPDLWNYYKDNIPLNRTGTPQDIANMALFLVSDKAEWITGKIFEVDGGHIL